MKMRTALSFLENQWLTFQRWILELWQEQPFMSYFATRIVLIQIIYQEKLYLGLSMRPLTLKYQSGKNTEIKNFIVFKEIEILSLIFLN